MPPFYIAFVDESGKEATYTSLIAVCCSFPIEQYGKFERDMSILEVVNEHERKLKKLLSQAEKNKSILNQCRDFLLETDFVWWSEVIPNRDRETFESLERPEIQALNFLQGRFSSFLEQERGLGSLIWDEGFYNDEKRAFYDEIRSSKGGLSRLVGTLSFLPSERSAGIWLADSIAYLLELWLNKRKWGKSQDDLWRVLRERLHKPFEGIALGGSIRVFPARDELEKRLDLLFSK